jgi:fatty-acyl-CoA synthase
MEDPFNGDSLPKCPANYVAMTPVQFLERTAFVHPDRDAVIHGSRRLKWRDVYMRSRRLASAIQRRGIRRGQVVSVMLTNTPEHLECMHGVPLSGAVLNPLNYRLDARNIAFCLRHAGAKLLITDTEYSASVSDALSLLKPEERPVVIDVDDETAELRGPRLGAKTYDELLLEGDEQFQAAALPDEWDALALCYTSGTTADPKGVVLHHRGCFLNALNNAVTWGMERHSVYLWTLPMFHCCGWCFPWTVTALAGTHVCLRRVDTGKMFSLISEHRVSHFCGAPIIMSAMIAHAGQKTWNHSLKMMVAAAAPPAPVIAGMRKLGIEITHSYGLTEVFGPAVFCEWKNEEWDSKPIEEQAAIKARQGVRYLALDGLMVADPETLQPVPQDGESLGEVFMRGNLVMKGYLKNPAATEQVFKGGWFHSGDLAVWCKDGYIQLKDRSKDIIISGGENISSLEVESILYKHPKVQEVAVVARDDEQWGETPCAFLELKAGESVSEEELFKWCQENMVRYMVPRTFIFTTLPKTSTGKVQKHVLRKLTKDLKQVPFGTSSKLFFDGKPASKL